MQGVLVVTGLFGVLAVLVGFSRWLAGRPWAAAGNLLIAVLLFAFVHVVWPAAANLATYHPLPQAEGPVAQLFCERTGPGTYRVTLTRLPGGRMQMFELAGDEWRLDIRTLAWREGATRLGLVPSFRLDRLSARYLSPTPVGTEATATQAPPSGYSLADADEPGEDVWAQTRTGLRWTRFADAGHAYGPWRPLADGGRFDVWLTQKGGTALEARPGNEAAAKAVQARNRAQQAVAAR